MSLRARLLLLLMALWLPAVLGFALLAWYVHEQEVETLERQVAEFAEAMNTDVEQELDKRVVMARTLASTRAAREGDLARLREESLVATEGTGNWVLVTDDAMHLMSSIRPYPTAPVPRARRDVALAQATPKIVFVRVGPVSGKPAVAVYVPVAGPPPARYAIGVAFEPAVMQGILMREREPFRALVTVADQDDTIMARSRDPEAWLGKTPSAAFKARMQAGGTGFADSVTLDGVQSSTYLSERNAYGWSVVVAIPKSDLLDAAWRASSKALFATAALLVIGLLVAMHAARGINWTLIALHRAAADLGMNKVPARLQSGVREIDEVGAALHAAGLKASEANSTLERRVAEAVSRAEDAQARLAHGQKLEIIGRLTAGIAHDFNNLLQTIATAHHLLQRHASSEAARKTLASAARATSKAADLVRQLMTFGRVQPLRPEAVDVAQTIMRGHELAGKAVGERISLRADLEPGLPPIYVDAAQFEAALLNLLFNARDALPQGGHITIIARRLPPAERDGLGQGEFVGIEVADDGTGMSVETLARAFDPYFTTKGVGEGTGLGLAQVQAFARQSGGESRIRSAPGRGTTVSMLLPAAAASLPTDDRPGHDAGPPPATGLRVLMVEDDPLVSTVVSGALAEHGFAVEVCHNVDDAQRALERHTGYDVLYTDVVMPGTRSGLDLAQWCHAHRPELPVVVVTGYAENISDLPVTVLRKPVDIERVVATLHEAAAASRR